jgi:hypothetical protein
MGRKMQWVVGFGDIIMEDQLLSTKDKRDVVLLMQQTLKIVREGMQEAVELKIFPNHVLTNEVCSNDSIIASEDIDLPSSSGDEDHDELVNKFRTLLQEELREELEPIKSGVVKIDRKLDNVENLLCKKCGEIVEKQRQLLQKLQDTETMFLEDRQ